MTHFLNSKFQVLNQENMNSKYLPKINSTIFTIPRYAKYQTAAEAGPVRRHLSGQTAAGPAAAAAWNFVYPGTSWPQF